MYRHLSVIHRRCFLLLVLFRQLFGRHLRQSQLCRNNLIVLIEINNATDLFVRRLAVKSRICGRKYLARSLWLLGNCSPHWSSSKQVTDQSFHPVQVGFVFICNSSRPRNVDLDECFEIPCSWILLKNVNNWSAFLFDDFHAFSIEWVWFIIPGCLFNKVHRQVVKCLRIRRQVWLLHVLCNILGIAAGHHVESGESVCYLLLADSHCWVCISIQAIYRNRICCPHLICKLTCFWHVENDRFDTVLVFPYGCFNVCGHAVGLPPSTLG